MNTWRKLLALVVGLGLYGACVSSAEAQVPNPVRIYKVTYSAKARVFPGALASAKGNSIKHTGYVVLQRGVNVATIELFKDKTFQVNGGEIFANIAPEFVGLSPINRSTRPGGFTHEYGVVAGTSGNTTMARSYLGTIPRNGFRFNLVSFQNTNIAKSVAGMGSMTKTFAGPFTEHYTVKDKWTVDKLSGDPVLSGGPAQDVNDGVGIVTAFLTRKRYVSR